MGRGVACFWFCGFCQGVMVRGAGGITFLLLNVVWEEGRYRLVHVEVYHLLRKSSNNDL